MKRLLITLATAIFTVPLWGQSFAVQQDNKSAYTFTDQKVIPVTSVKNQSSSGTCWSFAGLAGLEAELLRMGKGEFDLSEMWIVRHTYFEKAVKYVRMHGKAEFSGGGATHDVFDVIEKYGIVPEEVYTGLHYGTDIHRHQELDAVLKGYVDAIIKNPNNKLTISWMDGVNGILDAYLGEVPETFSYNGTEYTPQSFARSLGLVMSDYITFTSYTHHPFYVQFALEIPDNWAWGLSYNVPWQEMMQTVDYALDKGYTVNWGSDVSEPGFLYQKGWAIIPSDQPEDNSGSEESKWVSLSANQRRQYLASITSPMKEINVTQELRQFSFDNYETTDDHGMLIMGTAVDQNGNVFYKVKNSWGTGNLYECYFYASVPFVAYKTMNITLHKDAIPRDIKKKLGIR